MYILNALLREKAGAFKERIQYETRFFIPTGEEGISAIEKITKNRPVVDYTLPAGKVQEPTMEYQATPGAGMMVDKFIKWDEDTWKELAEMYDKPYPATLQAKLELVEQVLKDRKIGEQMALYGEEAEETGGAKVLGLGIQEQFEEKGTVELLGDGLQ